jgi:hypothetical protein
VAETTVKRCTGKAMGQMCQLVEYISRNKCFCFQVRIPHVLHFMSISDLFTDFPLY